MFFSKLTKTCLILCTAFTVGAQAQETVLDSTACIVNNDIILESELNKATAEVIENFKKRGTQINELSARKAALESLVTDSLIMQMAKAQGITITDLQLDNIIAQNAISNNTTPEAMLATLGENLSVAAQREKLRQNLIVSEIKRARIRARVNVSDTEVELLANNLKQVGSVEPRYHLSQLIVPLSPRATNEQAQRASNTVDYIKSELKKGANFNELAARYTTGELAAQGGDLGFMPESQVPAPFLPALLKAQAGDVVGPFRSPFGLHLLKLIEISHDAVAPIVQYDASHILLTTSVIFSNEAAYNELMALRQKILSGEISFEVAARKFSEDPGSASKGGELGLATPDIYDAAFAKAMVSLHDGEISMPVQSSFGWHLIRLNKTVIDTNSDEAYKARARELIYNRLYAEQAINWEQELRETAFIQVLDPQLAGATLNIDIKE